MLFLVYALIMLLPLPSCLLLCQDLTSTCPLLQKLFERCTFSTKISLPLPSFSTRRIALCDEPFVMTQDSPLPVAAFQRLGHSATSMISKTERRVFRASSVSVSLSLGDMFPTPPFPGLALFGTVNSSGLSLSTTSFRRRPSRDWHSLGLSTLRDCHSRRHLSDAALFGIGAHVAVENLSFENRSRGCCVGIVSHTFLAIGAESVDSMLSPSAQPCVSRSPPPRVLCSRVAFVRFFTNGFSRASWWSRTFRSSGWTRRAAA